MEREKVALKKMPDKETLEQYVNQGHTGEKTKVSFNRETGEFEWIAPREEIKSKPVQGSEGW